MYNMMAIANTVVYRKVKRINPESFVQEEILFHCSFPFYFIGIKSLFLNTKYYNDLTCVCVCVTQVVSYSETQPTVAHQAPLSIGFLR